MLLQYCSCYPGSLCNSARANTNALIPTLLVVPIWYQKLKERRDAQIQDNQEDDNAMPATPNLVKSYSLSDEPIGHHVLECSKETLQDTLKEVIHSTPVKPSTGPLKIVHPFPEVSPQTLLPPPPEFQPTSQ